MTANTCWNKNPFTAASCAVIPAPQPPTEEDLIRIHAEHFKRLLQNERLGAFTWPIMSGDLAGYQHHADTTYRDPRFLATLSGFVDASLMKMPFGFDVDSWYVMKRSGRYGSVVTWERYHREWNAETKKIIDELVDCVREQIAAELERKRAEYRKRYAC